MASREAPIGPVSSDTPDTPIMRLFREHEELRHAGNAYFDDAPHATDEELERLFWAPRDRVEKRIMALPPTCAADFAAKCIVGTCYGERFDEWQTGELWKEARALTGGQV